MNIPQILFTAYHRRLPYLKNNFDACRLYDKEDFELPVGIDIYKEHAVIFLFAEIHQAIIKQIEDFLRKNFKIKDFFYKNKIKNGENIAIPVTAIAPNSTTPASTSSQDTSSQIITIREYGHLFSINLSDYLDTGIFLDHRETRHWIEKQSSGKTVLNLFAYTGSFSIYAAKGGAAKTYSVDLSQTYCDWMKENLALNHLSPEKNWVFKMDTFEFFKYAQRKKLSFDIIIIDPPTFSRHKGKSFSVERDHPLLINTALELLAPNGMILFSNNKRGFKIKKNELTPCRIKNIKQQTWPEDFSDRETHHCFLIEAI